MVLPMFISVDSYVVPFLWCLMRSGTQLCLLMFARRVLCSGWWLRVQLRRGCHQGFRASVVFDWASIRGVTWLQLLMRARRLRCCAIDCQRGVSIVEISAS